MQRRVRKHWRRSADFEAKPKRPKDFGFVNSERYVLETCKVWVMSNYQVMPKPGGWDAQDEAWKIDAMMYLAGYAYYQWRAWQKKHPEQPGQAETKQEYEPLDWTQYT